MPRFGALVLLLALVGAGCGVQPGARAGMPDDATLAATDCDRNGSLSYEEVSRSWFISYGNTPIHAVTESEYQRLDYDRNGTLNSSEFASLFLSNLSGHQFVDACGTTTP